MVNKGISSVAGSKPVKGFVYKKNQFQMLICKLITLKSYSGLWLLQAVYHKHLDVSYWVADT